MTPIEVTQRYYEAWTGRDADALVATFTKDGTYCSPDKTARR
jgi:ketosteroid isomerase-like protein